jgi:two-component system, NarL family, response regulator DevR
MDCTGEEASRIECDVVILDFLDRAWFAKMQIAPNAKLLLIAMNEMPDQLLLAIRAGASGYLSQTASRAEVLEAVRSLQKGMSVCPQELLSSLFLHIRNSRCDQLPIRSERTNLTLHQRRLMSLVAEGLTNKQVAQRLHLSEYTVRNHMRRIMKRVNAPNRQAAVDAIS